MILKSGSDTPYTGRQCVSRTKDLNFYFHLGVLLLFNKGPFKVCLTCSLNLQLLCMVTPEKDRLLHWDIANLPILRVIVLLPMSSLHLPGLQIILFSLDQFTNSSSKRSDGSELLLTGAMIVKPSAYLKRAGTSL